MTATFSLKGGESTFLWNMSYTPLLPFFLIPVKFFLMESNQNATHNSY